MIHLSSGACTNLFGMKDGTIPDNQITASSQFSAIHSWVYARLDIVRTGNIGGGWATLYNNQDQWIQVDLGELQTVSGIITQGRQDYNQWVTEYQVEYSTDCSTWQSVQDDNGDAMVSNYGLRLKYIYFLSSSAVELLITSV